MMSMSLKIECIKIIESLQKINSTNENSEVTVFIIISNSSKAFHNHEVPTNKQKSLSELVDKITSKI